MGLKSKSSFLYGHRIISGQNIISVDVGFGEAFATLRPGGYTFSELAVELQRALNDATPNSWTVLTNRQNRTFNIATTVNFDLLAGTGQYAGSDVYFKLGFNQVDKTGANNYTSDFATGVLYKPQAPLFDYVDSQNNQDAVEASINQSGNGSVEIIKYGRNFFMECSIRYINDYKQLSPLFESNQNATSEARSFLEYITDKNRIEFMPDRDDASVFEKFILERTEKSDKGLGFIMRELISQGLVGYFETGRLVFRKVL